MTTSIRIPLRPNLPRQDIQVTLDGRSYTLSLDWIGRIQRWSFSLYAADGTAIVEGKGFVGGANLVGLKQHDPACPQGILALVDHRETSEPATLSSLGLQHILYFVPLDQIP